MLLSLISGALLLASFNGFAQEKAEAPSYKDGDVWQYRVTRKDWLTRRSRDLAGDYEVMFSDGNFWVFSLSDRAKTEIDQGASSLRSMMASRNDERRFLQFPLIFGKEWPIDYQERLPGIRNINWPPETGVIGIEEVSTLAGVFRAFKIERDFDVLSRGCWTYTYFYSPETRSIVKYHYKGSCGKGYWGGQIEIELIKVGQVQ